MAKPQATSKPSKGGNGFLPANYVPPSAASNFMKFESGENKFRILGNPVTGWVEWVDKKPLRYDQVDAPEATSDDPDEKPKHFWALKVWDYSGDGAIKILEITQASVIKAIAKLNSDEEWGNPSGYDIKVTRTGESLKTKYTVTPSPKKPVSKEIAKADASKPCNLSALFENEDPWAK